MGVDPPADRVLLLLEPGRDRELFAERLADHDLVVGDPDGSIPEFDCCLVDTTTYPAVVDALAERKAETGPHLPVLLVVGPDEREEVVRESADLADDVLPLPTSWPVLRNRVDSLLRARRDSLRLNAERERFRTLAETAPNAILTIDSDGVVRYANPAIEQVFGHPPEAVTGEPLTMLMPQGLREAHREGLSRYVETGERSLDWTGSRLPGRHADGHEIPLLLAFAEHWTGGERRFTGIVQDISEQVERERELERTVDLLGKTQTIADIGGWEIDAETLGVLWTEQVYEIVGLPVGEEPPLEKALELYHPADRSRVEAAVEDALETAEPFDMELRIQRPNGEVRWVRVRGEPESVDGEVEMLRGTIQDITERRERERELERTVDLLDRTQSMADVAGWVVDAETLELTWTDQLFELLGIPVGEEPPLDEALGFYHPEDRPRIEAAIAAALSEGEPFDLDLRVVRADDEVRWVRTVGEPVVVDGEVETFRGTFQDITERMARQAELERTLDLLDRSGEIAEIGGFENDFDTGDVVWTSQTYDILGLSPSYEPDLDGVPEFYHPDDRAEVLAAIENTLETGEPFDLEVRVVTADDREQWVRLRGEPTSGDGDVIRGTIQDISDRKKREQELERYETVLETVPEAAWVLDERLEVVFADSNAAESAGLTREEIVGKPTDTFRDTLFPNAEAYTEYVGAAEAILAGERENAEVVTELSLVDGAVVVEIGLSPLTRDGEIEGVVGLARDITGRIERQRELERTVDMLDRAERIADVGGWQYDPAAEELMWSEQVYRISGLDPATEEPDVEEAIDLYHPEDRPIIAEAFERALEEGEPYDLELRIVRPSGDVRWVRTIGEPEVVDGRRVVRGAFQDIHARKERERELERTVAQLRQTRDIADVGAWEYDPDTEEVWWDGKVWDIHGQLASFEPTAESVMALYTPASRNRMERAMERAVVEFESFDIEIEVATEPTRWVRVTGEPQVEDGHTTVVRGVVRDITGPKRREKFLQRHERIVETADEPIYTLDADLRLTLVNGALAGLFGRNREELLGEHVSTVFGDAHAEALGDAATKLYARDDDDPITVETVITDASGRPRYYQTTVSPKFDADGFQGLVCVSHDVSDLTEHERRLSVLDRVLRHNLRNKMNVVLARAQDIQREATDPAAVEAGASIEAAAEELLGLGEAARTFHDTLDPAGMDLVAVEDIATHAGHVVEAARASYDDVTVDADLPDRAWALVHAEFELALGELVDNAATHGGAGTTVTVAVERAGDEVVVRVLDDGPGIPVLERRALEAGSESPLQHATGLGLWFVQWTVRNSGGTMHIDDREGGGAVVELRLPAADPDE
ncbi:PAS domain S-box protein [Haloglomus litoreum]|uniref:PAS domain S-box protein n=1 Tax=Haloglomus litoreum TaxID=3034026 RepID=UPI0023E8565A|nr:PAS domain S-box protein [Haloglomus sp. DT116]